MTPWHDATPRRRRSSPRPTPPGSCARRCCTDLSLTLERARTDPRARSVRLRQEHTAGDAQRPAASPTAAAWSRSARICGGCRASIWKVPPAAHRFRVPGLQPVSGAERARAGHAAAGLSRPRPQQRRTTARGLARGSRPGRARAAASDRVVRRRKAARRDRACAGEETAICCSPTNRPARWTRQRQDRDRFAASRRPHLRRDRGLRQPRSSPGDRHADRVLRMQDGDILSDDHAGSEKMLANSGVLE